MKNLDSVFAAYIIGWADFFCFLSDHRKTHVVFAGRTRPIEELLAPGQVIGGGRKKSAL